MIPSTRTREIDNQLGAPGQQFSIAVNSKSFEILTDRLYEDKIQSMIRELCSNAYDSHVEAGCADKPFKLTLPTFLDPKFAVRDYGTGMDHETVMELYSTLFATSKDTSNDFTGYIGIGSKSPFAYTNTFTVTAFDGVNKRSYVVSRNENNIPEISYLGEFECDEPCGVEVSMAADSKDSHEFTQKAQKVVIAYDTLPECNVELVVPGPILEGEEWTVYATPGGSWDDKYAIQQGTVVYPYRLPTSAEGFMSSGFKVIVKVPIGSVSVAASRESLSLDDETRELVDGIIEQTREDIIATGNRFIDEAPNWREAASKFKTLKSMLYLYGGQNTISWDPNKGPHPDQPVQLEFDGHIKVYQRNYKAKYATQERKGDKTLLPWQPQNNASWNPYNYNKTVVITRSTDDKIVRMKSRISNVLGETEGIWIEDPSNKDLEKLWRLIGVTEFIHASSIPDPGPAQGSSTGATSSGYLRGVVNHAGYKIKELPEDYVWVAFEGKRKSTLSDTRVSLTSTRFIRGGPSADRLWDAAQKEITLPTDTKEDSLPTVAAEIIYVTPTVAKKMPEKKSLDYLVKKAYASIEDLEKRATANEVAGRVRSLTKTSIAKMILEQEGLSDPSYETVINHMTYDYDQVRKQVELDVEDLIAKYPMVFQTDRGKILEYIQECDSK